MIHPAPSLSADIAATFSPTAKQPSKAAVRAQTRLALVAQIIRDSGNHVPTHLQLLNELRRRGVKTSKGTVMNDLFALGLSEAPTAYGRHREAVEVDGEF